MMTETEAIRRLEDHLEVHRRREPRSIYISEALEMAMKSLEGGPTAHWINYKDEHQCSNCREFVIAEPNAWEDDMFEYCPHCGAKMGESD